MLKTTRILIATWRARSEAQQVVAPTAEPVGSPRGDSIGDYNVTQSFEFGYRWNQTGGDLGYVPQVVNFRRGLRLLGSSLSVNSKDGHGRYFDEILLNTTGLGNDPYEAVSLRIQKNSLYRYDMSWRMNDYFNPGLTVAGSACISAIPAAALQDHDLTLLPQLARPVPRRLQPQRGGRPGAHHRAGVRSQRIGPAGLHGRPPPLERVPPGHGCRNRRVQADLDPPLGFLQGRQRVQPHRHRRRASADHRSHRLASSRAASQSMARIPAGWEISSRAASCWGVNARA